MNITIPEIALVVLIGVSGSGKSTFARTHFKPTEVLSSDYFRGLISDDETDQTITKEAFETLHYVAAKRLANYKLTVIDATSVQESARKPLVALAKQHHVFPIAIVFDMPEDLCRERNKHRPDRNFAHRVIAQQRHQLRRSLRRLKREGFRRIYTLRSEDEVQRVCVTREKVWPNRRDERGPFDIIGDVHGCYDELLALLDKLGYDIQPSHITPPPGRKAIFLGDLVDRGPKTPQVLDLVMQMVDSGTALCVPGNHDTRLVRALQGKKVRPTYGLSETLEQLESYPIEDHKRYAKFLDSLVSHYILDNGNLIVAHAGMKEELAGRTSGTVRAFALYGETTGETDEYGLPIRLNWAARYRGKATVVYGHTPVSDLEWLNNTINIDTGCTYGGALTALRYPEKESVSVPALKTYSKPSRPLASQAARSAQQTHDDMLDIDDIIGKRAVDTFLIPRITIREEHAIAALEIMSRYAIDPKWLIYLPPTMSPSKPSSRPNILEHPDEAYAYYRENNITQVIAEEKHMGSRAIVILCKNDDIARARFGLSEPAPGACYTRTGRSFFDDTTLETAFLTRLQNAVSKADLWNSLNTTWIALDCELMPWSARAQQLLQEQYAAVGASARASLNATLAALNTTAANNIDIADWLAKYEDRSHRIDHYIHAYRAYCWPVHNLTDLKLSPFHILATEGSVHHNQPHLYHMETLSKLCVADPELLHATSYRVVDLNDTQSCANTTAWWKEKTAQGSEGMVVKPIDFIAKNKKGRLIQPAIKCRGREYLRIIYGPEYTTPENLEKLRWRNVKTKQSLALREFALGLEALSRFVQNEPLRRIHECVFGVLALETEPIDPRL